MRRLLELVEEGRWWLDAKELASLDAASFEALRAAGIVRAGDPGKLELSPPDLARALRVLWRVATEGVPVPSTFDPLPVLLGWTGKGAERREVLFVARPSLGLEAALSWARPALVLVPTARQGIDAPTGVVVAALEAVLTARAGRLVRTDAESTERPETRAPSVVDGAALLSGATRWNQIRICVVEKDLLRVDLPGRSVRVIPSDLGMAHARSRQPTVLWEALFEICERHGQFKTTRFGGEVATKKVISRLRARLKAVFALRASPFFRYSGELGWRVRFEVRHNLPGEPDEDYVTIPRVRRA